MGQDSCVQIQKQCSVHIEEDLETIELMKKVDNKFHSNTFLLRQMKNNFNGKEISVGAISVYHGLIAVGSADKNVYIWDY